MANRIEVILADQEVKVFEGGSLKWTFICVTGDSDNPTVPGTFTITRRSKDHVSNEFNVKMHYAQFFDGGKALHQYHGVTPLSVVRALKQNVTDWFGSHGCVRLLEEDAKALFDWAKIGTTVQVI